MLATLKSAISEAKGRVGCKMFSTLGRVWCQAGCVELLLFVQLNNAGVGDFQLRDRGAALLVKTLSYEDEFA